MSDMTTIVAKKRDRAGKGGARAARRDGLIPAVIYGDKQPPLPIAVEPRQLLRVIHGEGFLTHRMAIDVEGTRIEVLPRDVQLDPVTDRPLHFDFLRIGAGSVITVDVPVHFRNEGASPGIKRGGILNVIRHAITVRTRAMSRRTLASWLVFVSCWVAFCMRRLNCALSSELSSSRSSSGDRFLNSATFIT